MPEPPIEEILAGIAARQAQSEANIHAIAGMLGEYRKALILAGFPVELAHDFCADLHGQVLAFMFTPGEVAEDD